MPKEYVYSNDNPNGFRVRVGWSREQCVQMAIVDANEEHRTEVSLTRREINQCIRLLRKARDHAFGGDA